MKSARQTGKQKSLQSFDLQAFVVLKLLCDPAGIYTQCKNQRLKVITIIIFPLLGIYNNFIATILNCSIKDFFPDKPITGDDPKGG